MAGWRGFAPAMGEPKLVDGIKTLYGNEATVFECKTRYNTTIMEAI